jgi:predicted DNA repair protein MutK
MALQALPMAGTSLLALIDDIATVLDDVALLTKVATKKTAGVLGDDLALNAQQVTGLTADRELPVVWAVAKGSALNKLILVPLALAISQFIPWAVTPLLMVGGAFLCFEGCEKLAHKFLHGEDEDKAHEAELLAAVADPAVDLVALEKEKIKGAVRTDFVLSAEIVTIALGTVAESPFVTRLAVLFGISAVMTVGVYGLVGGIVKLDDLGQFLVARAERGGALAGFNRVVGAGLLSGTPYFMKTLSIAGTAAMFLVGGGILAHGIPPLHHWVEQLTEHAHALPFAGGLAAWLVSPVVNALVGIVAGAIVLVAWMGVQKVRRK